MSADMHMAVLSDESDTKPIIDFHVMEANGSWDKVVYDRYIETIYTSHPEIWIGQLSSSDNANGVPRAVKRIADTFSSQHGVIRITPSFISVVTTAFNLPHDSVYEKPDIYGQKSRGINKARSVKRFLNENINKLSFIYID